jgi:hypothetical protein
LPVRKSGRNRSWSRGLPNLRMGGTPYPIPAVREVGGPLSPDRAICEVHLTVTSAMFPHEVYSRSSFLLSSLPLQVKL